jgi:hypothetical protein
MLLPGLLLQSDGEQNVVAINTPFSGFYQTKKPIDGIGHLMLPGKRPRKCDRLGVCVLDCLLEQLRGQVFDF